MRIPNAARWRVMILGLLLTTACDSTTTDVSRAPSTLRFAVTYSAAAADVNVQQIRLTAQVDGVSIATATINVNPADLQWNVAIDVDPTRGSDVIVLIELLDGDGHVVWSGRSDRIHIVAGRSASVTAVNLLAGPIANENVTGVHVTPRTSSVFETDHLPLHATFDGGTAGSAALWASLNSSVATVNGNGVVTGVQPGSARIIAAAGAGIDTITITVLPKPVHVIVTPASATLSSIGDTSRFTARVVDARGNDVPGAAVTWTAFNGDALLTRGGGVYVAHANGAATVIATANGTTVAGTADVQVSQRVVSIHIQPDSALLAVGAHKTFAVVALDARGHGIARGVTWSTSDGSVASVDTGGVVTGVNSGNALVTATMAQGGGSTQTVSVTGKVRVSATASGIADIEGSYEFTGSVTGMNANVSGTITIRNQYDQHGEILLTIFASDRATNQVQLAGLNVPGTISIDAQGHITASATTQDGTFTLTGTWVNGAIDANWTATSPAIDNASHTLSGGLSGHR